MRESKHKKKQPTLLAMASMALMSSAALAQSPRMDTTLGGAAGTAPYSPSAAAASQEGSAQGGGMNFTFMNMPVALRPSVKLEMRHDDNIYLSPTNRSADQVLVLTPALTLNMRRGSNNFMLRLSTTIGQFQQHPADNYVSYKLEGQAALDLGTSLRANLNGAYEEGADPRGSTNNAISSTPDRYQQMQGRGIVSYGASGARGRIDFELGQVRRTYINNRAVTAASDRVANDVGATFHWRVGPKTELLLQGKHTKINYVSSASTLGSSENALLAGANWEATAKTKITFRAGTVMKEFDDRARAGSSNFSWQGEVLWSPLTYSHVAVNLNRAPAETTGGVGNFIDQTKTGARWTHEWNSRFVTEAMASYQTDEYQGAPRTDNIQSYGIKATYKMRRWLSLGSGLTHSERSSSSNNFDYQQNVLMLFLNATL